MYIWSNAHKNGENRMETSLHFYNSLNFLQDRQPIAKVWQKPLSRFSCRGMTSSDWWSRPCQTTSNWLLLKPLILYSPLSQWYYSSHCYFKCHVVLDIFNSWVVFSLALSWRWLVCMEGVFTLYCIRLWKWYQDDETLLYKSITWKWWKNL